MSEYVSPIDNNNLTVAINEKTICSGLDGFNPLENKTILFLFRQEITPH